MKICDRCFPFIQEQLKKMRGIDDKIVYALNTSIPTESFKKDLSAKQTCKELSEQLNIVYNDRNKLIRNCIASTANRIQELKQTKDNNPDDVTAFKSFKSESRKVTGLFSVHHFFLDSVRF